MIKLELTTQMVHAIGVALQKMPYEFSAPIIAELQKQISEQQKDKA